MSNQTTSIQDRFQELDPSSATLPQCPTCLSNEDGAPLSIDDPLELAISTANSLKDLGNKEFNLKRWQAALNKYSEAIVALPLPPPPGDRMESSKEEEELGDSIDRADEPSGSTPKNPDSAPSNSLSASTGKFEPQTSIDPRIPSLRSVLNANSAACHLKLEDWKSAVEACGASLRDNPKYVKALHRRAQANEKLGTWASLQASLDDYNTMEKLPDVTAQLKKEIRLSQLRLPPLITHRSEIDKAEMMSKLKDLGNTVLGKFGMSTDNFKFTPNESGGYSMSFER